MWDFENNQTLFLLHSADIWSTSSRVDICRCGSQTKDLLHLKKQTPPNSLDPISCSITFLALCL
ncbi:hypothetical protein Hdeb2414_s0008g00274721 [Helianthus debilis subsp. tardiflorus]